MKKFNYENKQYLQKLDNLQESYYSKYISKIKLLLSNKEKRFLDVGFGSGTVLKNLKNEGYVNGYGVDISKLFVQQGKKRGLSHLYYYDGTRLPFKDNYFDLIGSFNVLEHTEDPEEYLKEQLKKIKKKGKIIIACPNFLSVLFPSYHRRLSGTKNKTRNLLVILYKLIFNKSGKFEKMPPVIRKNFQYDDDAIVVTNLLDIERFLIKNRCTIIYESGFINYDSILFRFMNAMLLVKYMLPSCFIVAQKI